MAQVRDRELLAYFTKITAGCLKQTVSADQLRQLRRELYHWCLAVNLAPLKALSHTGTRLADPYGVLSQVFPELLTFVCDHPGAMLISGIMDSAKTVYPCDQCWCPCEELHDVSVQHEPRLETEQQENCQRIVSKTLVAAESRSTRCSAAGGISLVARPILAPAPATTSCITRWVTGSSISVPGMRDHSSKHKLAGIGVF